MIVLSIVTLSLLALLAAILLTGSSKYLSEARVMMPDALHGDS